MQYQAEKGLTETHQADYIVAPNDRLAGPTVVPDSWLNLDEPLRTGTSYVGQRTCDIILSLLLLVLCFPLFLLLALLIVIDSRGPALFVQRRVGINGKLFSMYKFRSMYSGAEDQVDDLLSLNERDGPVFKLRNDPRITRMGRVLRKLSLDEFPQLLNVLLGDMSLVGPRPALPREVDEYNAIQRQRLVVLPGLTGLWQISGRSTLPFDESIELDLYYIRHNSILLYLIILIKTIPAVIGGKGAY